MSGLWLIDYDDEPEYTGDEWVDTVTEKDVQEEIDEEEETWEEEGEGEEN